MGTTISGVAGWTYRPGLLMTIAVLAIAFAISAAMPAVVDDSDAAIGEGTPLRLATEDIGEDISADRTYGETEDVAVVDSLTIRDGSTVTVLGGFHVVEGVVLTIEAGSTLRIGSDSASLVVDGAVVVEEGASLVIEEAEDIDISGSLTVLGLVQTMKKLDYAPGLDAAMYERTVSGVPNYIYTDLGSAVGSDADVIDVYGTVGIYESLTVPAGKTVRANGDAVIAIGDRGVVLTFADGSMLEDGTVDVKGTLEFEDKDSDRARKIVSDTSVIGDVGSRYTNVYTALEEAKSGDVVTITSSEVVRLDADVTIGAGVTLDVPVSGSIMVMDGVTVTVDGTLRSVDMVHAESNVVVDGRVVESGFAETASDKVGEERSAIVVNGTFMSMTETDYSYYYHAAGAYYSIVDSAGDLYHYITPLEAAAAVATEVEGSGRVDAMIHVSGKVTAGDVKFTGTEDVHIMVFVDGDLTVSSITLEETTFFGLVSGTIVAEDAQVIANKASVRVYSYADDGAGMILDGWTEEIEGSGLNVASGKVCLNYAKDMVVDVGAVAVIPEDATAEADGLIVDGTLEIEAGATLDVIEGLTVDSRGTLTINGTLTVSEGTGTRGAGTLNVTNLYVGVSDGDVRESTGAGASVSGPVTIGKKAVVLDGSVLSESTMRSMEGMGSTAYCVEGSVWVTVHAKEGSGVLINEIDRVPVENARFDVWNDGNGNTVGDGVEVGAEGYGTVHAVIEYVTPPSDDDGIGTIALIAIVILVIVMAVIAAMRVGRSG